MEIQEVIGNDKSVIVAIEGHPFIPLSRYAYNQILNKIWSVKEQNNELIIYDENNIEIDRF